MSIDALSWAFNMTLPSPATKLTLLALANYANEDSEAYPSYKTLCKKTCLSDRAIRKHLVILEKLGVLTKQARTRENGSSTSNIFRMHIGVDPVDQTKIASEEEVTPPGTACHPPLAPGATPPRHGVPPHLAPGATPDPSLTTTVTNDPPNKPLQRNVLPQCIKSETWGKFVGMRDRIRKPLTYEVIAIIFENLQKMHADGHDVNAVLEQSIVNSWAGIFTVKAVQALRTEKFDGRKFVNRHAGAGGSGHEKLVS